MRRQAIGGISWQLSVLLVLLTASLVACETSYTLSETERYFKKSMLVDYFDIERQHQRALSSAANFYIARNISEPNNLVKERVSYHLQAAFGTHFNSAMSGPADEDLRSAIKTARAFRSQYVIYPTLQIWNSNTRRWQNFRYERVSSKRIVAKALRPGDKRSRHWTTGKQSEMQEAATIKRLRLALRLIDTASEQQIDNIQVYANAGLMSSSRNRPLERLNEPLMLLAGQMVGR